ncbi:MAG: hypothetical protein ACPGWR_28850 [Ardenticatenaceae bacterium]
MNSHLTDEQLEMLLEGEGQAHQVAHVRNCEACRTRLAMIAARERLMLRMLHRVTCPPPLTLFEHAAGLTLQPTIAAHIDPTQGACPHCVKEVGALAEWERFPLFLKPRPLTLIEKLRRVVGRLIPRPVLSPSLRGTPAPINVYEAGEVILTVDCLPSMTQVGRKALHGSLLALDGGVEQYEGFIVRLLKNNTIVSESCLSSYGGFVFEELPQGHYQVLVALPGQHVVIDDLRVN